MLEGLGNGPGSSPVPASNVSWKQKTDPASLKPGAHLLTPSNILSKASLESSLVPLIPISSSRSPLPHHVPQGSWPTYLTTGVPIL